jgi:class 3 adenylate cyclase
MMTDIVGSTATASRLGDARWRELLADHDAVVRGTLARFRGEELVHTGDGIVASFDGPTRAVMCAQQTIDALADLGLRARIGLHTGEIEVGPDATTGLAIHLASRAMAVATSGGIVASGTVRDLTFGSGIAFHDLGEHRLKGVPDTWRLYEVASTRSSGAGKQRTTPMSSQIQGDAIDVGSNGRARGAVDPHGADRDSDRP